MYNKLSPATKLLIQSFLAVLGAVLSGVAVAAYQSYTNAGRLDLQALINVCLVTFALLFGKAMHDWIPAHAQALIKEAQNDKAAMYEALTRSQNVTSAVVATQGRQVQSTLQVAQPATPHVVVQPAIAPALKSEDVSAIAAQLAVNLINIAADRASQAAASTPPVAPAAPVSMPMPQPSTDGGATWQVVNTRPQAAPASTQPVASPAQDTTRHFGDSQLMPVAIPDQATQSVPVPFTV